MMWLSDDHTGGPVTARSHVAGGDLALGKIVDTISHSQYWKDSAIFVLEDDSQSGVDHVDGHRAPIQVISPWAVHGKTISTYYSQISMVRTIEQILGAEPLNQKVAAATPMFDAFQSRGRTTPVQRAAEPGLAHREHRDRACVWPRRPGGAGDGQAGAGPGGGCLLRGGVGGVGSRSSTSAARCPRPISPTLSR